MPGHCNTSKPALKPPACMLPLLLMPPLLLLCLMAAIAALALN
jgi:hypothetical protein